MKVVTAGRLVFPEDSEHARSFARHNLVSVRKRSARLMAIAGIVRMRPRPIPKMIDQPYSFVAEAESAAISEVVERATGALAKNDWILLRDYRGSARARSILFLWSRGGKVPSFVVRLRPTSAEGEPLRLEADSLRAVREAVDDDLRPTLPQVVSYDEVNGYEVLVVDLVSGVPLLMQMQRSLLPERASLKPFVAVGEWLGRMQRTSRRVMEGNAPASLLADHMAPAFVHGDFWARNILVERSKIAGVVDWERSRPVGPPWRDLFDFALLSMTNGPAWRARDTLDAFKNSFIESSSASRAVAAYLQSWADAAGADRKALRNLLEHYLLDAEALATQEEPGWRSTYPWQAMRALTATSVRTAFSG